MITSEQGIGIIKSKVASTPYKENFYIVQPWWGPDLVSGNVITQPTNESDYPVGTLINVIQCGIGKDIEYGFQYYGAMSEYVAYPSILELTQQQTIGLAKKSPANATIAYFLKKLKKMKTFYRPCTIVSVNDIEYTAVVVDQWTGSTKMLPINQEVPLTNWIQAGDRVVWQGSNIDSGIIKGFWQQSRKRGG